jgi:hypothetical protein
MKTKYKFSHRAGGRLYWTAPAPGFGPAYEELVSCNALWFWGDITDDDTLPQCSSEPCAHTGEWGATGIMPPGHVLVIKHDTSGKIIRQYLAHKEDQS